MGEATAKARGRGKEEKVKALANANRYLTGQAYLENEYTKEGTPIGIHQGGVMDRPATPAKVVSRFPKLQRLEISKRPRGAGDWDGVSSPYGIGGRRPIYF